MSQLSADLEQVMATEGHHIVELHWGEDGHSYNDFISAVGRSETAVKNAIEILLRDVDRTLLEREVEKKVPSKAMEDTMELLDLSVLVSLGHLPEQIEIDAEEEVEPVRRGNFRPPISSILGQDWLERSLKNPISTWT